MNEGKKGFNRLGDDILKQRFDSAFNRAILLEVVSENDRSVDGMD